MEILASEATKMQNVYTPLPLNVHVVFCIIATLLYLTLFLRKGSWHYLLMLAAVDLTIITQFWTQPQMITALGIAEAALLITAGFLSYKYNKEQKKLFAKELEQEKEQDDKAAQATKEQSDKDKKLR